MTPNAFRIWCLRGGYCWPFDRVWRAAAERNERGRFVFRRDRPAVLPEARLRAVREQRKTDRAAAARDRRFAELALQGFDRENDLSGW